MDKLPASLVLVVLILSSTFLTWKGLIPSHAFFMVAGGALAWVAPKLGQMFSSSSKTNAEEKFSPEETSTNPEGQVIEKKDNKS